MGWGRAGGESRANRPGIVSSPESAPSDASRSDPTGVGPPASGATAVSVRRAGHPSCPPQTGPAPRCNPPARNERSSTRSAVRVKRFTVEAGQAYRELEVYVAGKLLISVLIFFWLSRPRRGAQSTRSERE